MHLIIRLLFALGIEGEAEIIRKIENNANHYIRTNPDYLSREGKKWISTHLSDQADAIKMQIEECKNALE